MKMSKLYTALKLITVIALLSGCQKIHHNPEINPALKANPPIEVSPNLSDVLSDESTQILLQSTLQSTEGSKQLREKFKTEIAEADYSLALLANHKELIEYPNGVEITVDDCKKIEAELAKVLTLQTYSIPKIIKNQTSGTTEKNGIYLCAGTRQESGNNGNYFRGQRIKSPVKFYLNKGIKGQISNRENADVLTVEYSAKKCFELNASCGNALSYRQQYVIHEKRIVEAIELAKDQNTTTSYRIGFICNKGNYISQASSLNENQELKPVSFEFSRKDGLVYAITHADLSGKSENISRSYYFAKNFNYEVFEASIIENLKMSFKKNDQLLTFSEEYDVLVSNIKNLLLCEESYTSSDIKPDGSLPDTLKCTLDAKSESNDSQEDTQKSNNPTDTETTDSSKTVTPPPTVPAKPTASQSKATKEKKDKSTKADESKASEDNADANSTPLNPLDPTTTLSPTTDPANDPNATSTGP